MLLCVKQPFLPFFVTKSTTFIPEKTKCCKYSKCVVPEDQSTVYNNIKCIPSPEVCVLNDLYQFDNSKKKVNLCMSVYSGRDGGPFVLPIIQKCEEELAEDNKVLYEYLPVLGSPFFTRLACELLLGIDSPAISERRAFPIQTLAGTGALRLAGEFAVRLLRRKTCLIPKPTWECHKQIMHLAGFLNLKEYKVLDRKHHRLYFENILKEIADAPEGSVVLLQGCAQNPTGIDPTHEQWREIAELMNLKKHLPLFDVAYLGLASGDVDKDAWAVRYFVEKNFELLVCQSFSKNMGLYSERVGCLTAIFKNPLYIKSAASQFSFLANMSYSAPPAHGCRLVERVLGDKSNRCEWMINLNDMYNRVKKMRLVFTKLMKKHKTPLKWDSFGNQVGFFSYTDLSPEMIKTLIKKHHIYLLQSGRINFCGLNERNVEYVAQAIDDTVRESLKDSQIGKKCKC